MSQACQPSQKRGSHNLSHRTAAAVELLRGDKERKEGQVNFDCVKREGAAAKLPLLLQQQ